MRALLDGGVPPRSFWHDSPLGSALATGHGDIAALLLERGAVLDVAALRGAAQSGDPDVRALIAKTPLAPQAAADLLHAVVCVPELLAAVLPQVEGRISTNDPYHSALEECPEGVDALLAAGVRPTALPLTVAAQRSDVVLVRRLLAA